MSPEFATYLSWSIVLLGFGVLALVVVYSYDANTRRAETDCQCQQLAGADTGSQSDERHAGE